MSIRILGRGDEAALEAFLAPRSDSSMFLRSNIRRAGLIDEGQRFGATYAAEFAGADIVAVAASCWSGMLLLQAPSTLEVARVAVAHSGRVVTGLAGPRAQVEAARALLGLADRPAALDDCEDRFALSLAELRVPAPLVDGRWHCRAPEPDELPRLVRWRVAYALETLGATAGPALDAEVDRALRADPPHRVLVVDGEPRAVSGFNARLPDCVQVGGVYTPPEWRGRGYARAVVAGSLLAARDEGAGRAILFTSSEPARRAYVALGFLQVGDYSLVLFKSE